MSDSNYTRSLTSVFTDRFFRFLVIVLLFISLLLHQKNLILLSILVLIMFYIAKLWSHFSIKNIYYSFDAEKIKGFPGENISLQANIYNNKILPIWLKLLVPMDKRLNSSKKMENNCLFEEFRLLWFDKFLWKWSLEAQHRGYFQIGPPFIETGDIMGFFKEKKYLSESTVEVIIYPRPISLNFLSTPIRELFGKTGNEHPVKDPIYPIATRDYQHGDPAKFIHWKASARHNRLQSKIFDSSTQRKTLLIIDVCSFQKENSEEDFERVLEVVAAIIKEFDKQGSPYSILSNGKISGSDRYASFSFGTGSEQLSIAMELLARLTMEKYCPMEEILFKKINIPSGTGCLYCSFNINEDILQISQLLRKHTIPMYFLVAETSQELVFDSMPLIFLNEIYSEE